VAPLAQGVSAEADLDFCCDLWHCILLKSAYNPKSKEVTEDRIMTKMQRLMKKFVALAIRAFALAASTARLG
jgi:hypothetical protein